MKENNKKIIITLLSILVGFIFGGIILKIAGYPPIEAYKIIIEGIFGSPRYISHTIIRSTPIIITGISVAFAFNTGLFNIGAEGQFIMGSLGAALAGYLLNLPPVLHAIVAIITGAIFAGLWAGIVGVLKAKKGVNEVISSIMLNWVALYFNNYIISKPFFRRPNSDSSFKIMDSAKTLVLGNWKKSEAGKVFLAENKFLGEFLKPSVNYGFVIAIIIAIVIWYILKYTTLGYQLKAVGSNKEAAEYAGIDIEKNIIRSLVIAGAIAGIAGATHVLGVSHQVSLLTAPEEYGFDGMAVSLIGGNNPLGAIPAGLLFGALKYGGGKLNSLMNAPSEVISIMIGVIILFIAMPKLFEMLGESLFKAKDRDRGEKNG